MLENEGGKEKKRDRRYRPEVGVENGNTEMPGWGKNGQKSVWRKTGLCYKVTEV